MHTENVFDIKLQTDQIKPITGKKKTNHTQKNKCSESRIITAYPTFVIPESINVETYCLQ